MRLDPDTNEAHVWIAMNQIDKIWEQLFPAERTALFGCSWKIDAAQH